MRYAAFLLALPLLGLGQVTQTQPPPAPPAAPVVQPAPAAPTPPTAQPTPQGPDQLYGIGAGITGLGPSQVSGEYFVAQRIGQDTYAATITDFQRMSGGTVGTSARGAIYRTLWRFSNLSIGASGEAGAAEGATGSASGAVAYSGYLHFRIAKTPIGIIGTARMVKIAGVDGQQGQVRLGITFGTYSDGGRSGKP